MESTNDEVRFQSNIPVQLDIAVAVVYFFFGIFSVFGNSILLYVSYKKRHLLKPAEFFIINLAVSDLGLTLSLYPMAITSSIYHRWLYGRTVCSIYAFCGMLFGICSLSTLTLLSMVCFVKVCHPLYGNSFNSLHSRLLVAGTWVFALIFASSPLAHWGEYGPEPYGTACCIDWHLSNRHSTARSYTVVLFLCCYILPCCIIVASYTGILLTVNTSRKTMRQHAMRPAHAASIQTVIVKLSVAVCIGFFMAWSPYAIVSMWAAFGRIEDIPPMAFALPAMFAKSSTIYNPIIYLTLRPNFRKVIHKDLDILLHSCLKNPLSCCSKLNVPVKLGVQRPSNPSSDLSVHPATVALDEPSGEPSRKVCLKNFHRPPQTVRVAAPIDSGGAFKDQEGLVLSPSSHLAPRSGDASPFCAKETPEDDHLRLEMVPGQAKVAWP
ncbi:opsin-5-like [Synchiropus splendidus]|uniref:opsin-5-like n=1 Tax=Synchiropus splendidus TaxID=270530 RepID=UPI00237D7929|nr:opsin-5-like [Synchiropus splendidus]